MKNNVKKDKKTPLLHSQPWWYQVVMDLGGGAERSDGADFRPTALPQYPKKTAPPEGAGGGIPDQIRACPDPVRKPPSKKRA